MVATYMVAMCGMEMCGDDLWWRYTYGGDMCMVAMYYGVDIYGGDVWYGDMW